MIQSLTCRMEIASAYGLDCAVFMHHIVHWAMKNEAEGRHFHDGRYWAYSSYAALVRWFSPLWSIQQVKRLVAKCKDAGILLVGDFNEDSKSRVNWYAPSDAIRELYTVKPLAPGVVRNRTRIGPKSNQDWSEIEPQDINNNINISIPPIVPPTGDNPSAPDGAPPLQREDSEGKGEKPKGKPRKRREPKKAPDWKPDRFAAFWEIYPRGESKQAAIAAWDKLQADDELMAIMGKALKRQLNSKLWLEKPDAIPYASTWLNQCRWTDEVHTLPTAPAEQTDVRAENGRKDMQWI